MNFFRGYVLDFNLSDFQRELVGSTLKFSSDVLEIGAKERINNHVFDVGIWMEAAEFGFSGFPIPEEYGGSGLTALDNMLAMEALGKGCQDLGLAFSLAAHTFATAVPVWRFGSQFILEKYMKDIATGRLVAANAVTEPTSGSDIYSMKATAKKVSGGYKINGHKCFITNAPVADIFLVYAKTNKEHGFFGVSAFLVPVETAGLSVGKSHPKDSLCTSTWSDVFLDDVFVPESSRVGFEGAGGAIFHDSMIWEKGCLFAAYVGAMDRALDQALTHVKERVQFGKPIASYQSVSNRIIDMKLRLDASRLMLYRAGWMYDQGQECEAEIAMSKLMISESSVQSGLDLIQVFGASGIDREMGVIRLLLDAVASRIFSGTNEIQREIISRKLGLRK